MSGTWRKLYSFWKGQNAKTQSGSEWKSLELKKIYPMGLAVDSTATRQVISMNHLQEIQEVLRMGVGSESHSLRAY